MTLLVELGIWLCILLFCLYLTFQPAISQPSFGGPILTCLPPASRIIPGGLCLLRVQLQLDPDLASPAGFQKHFLQIDWETCQPHSCGGLCLWSLGGAWGARLRSRGADSLPRPVVGCCALINCPGTPDLVSMFIWNTFSTGFSSPSAYFFFFFKQELAFASY